MRRTLSTALAALLALWLRRFAGGVRTSRIKDLANIEGVRQNQLIGYGLVVGLNGTGDTLNNIAVHQAIPAGDAGTARRQHPRPARSAPATSPP